MAILRQYDKTSLAINHNATREEILARLKNYPEDLVYLDKQTEEYCIAAVKVHPVAIDVVVNQTYKIIATAAKYKSLTRSVVDFDKLTKAQKQHLGFKINDRNRTFKELTNSVFRPRCVFNLSEQDANTIYNRQLDISLADFRYFKNPSKEIINRALKADPDRCFPYISRPDFDTILLALECGLEDMDLINYNYVTADQADYIRLLR